MKNEVEKLKDDKNIILVVIIFVLVSIILMLTVYIVYDKVYLRNATPKGSESGSGNNTIWVDNTSSNTIQVLDLQSNFVQEMYDALSYEDATILFAGTDVSSLLAQGKVYSLSLKEISDRNIYRLVTNRVNGTIVSEDEVGTKTIQYKESDLRYVIKDIFGDSKSNSFDFSALTWTGPMSYGENRIESIDKEKGIIIANQTVETSAVIKPQITSKLLRAEHNIDAKEAYIYEEIVGTIDGRIEFVYNVKFIYGEENGVYYFRGFQIKKV